MTELTNISKVNKWETELGFIRRAGERLASGDDYFRDIVDLLPAAIYVTDASGRIIYYNDAAATLWGWRPELGTAEWCGSWKLFWPDGRAMAHGECPMAIAVKEGRPVFGMEAVAERPDGVRVPFLPFPTPLHDSLGNLVGAVNLLVDITDRKCAEQYAQQLASIVEFLQRCHRQQRSRWRNFELEPGSGAAVRLYCRGGHRQVGDHSHSCRPRR